MKAYHQRLVLAVVLAMSARSYAYGQVATLPLVTDLDSHGVTQKQLDTVAETMQDAVEQQQIAGCSFLLAHDGEILFRKAFGYADIDSKRPFTVDELVPIASVSKPFLASVIMALVDQGKLNLDDPVEMYLPAFKDVNVRGNTFPVQPMTLRHLLSHTAGFWGNKGISAEKIDLIRNFQRPLREAVSRMATYELEYQPGTRFVYSGSGYCVAGRVAEVVLGQSLETIARETLFQPLGLQHTTYLPSNTIRQTVPTAYIRQANGTLQPQASRSEGDLRFILPGGSLFTTLDELAVFGCMHLNDGVCKGRRVLSEESITEMRTVQSPLKTARTYGLGWSLDRVNESGRAHRMSHGGAMGAYLVVDRKRELVGAFLVCQTATQVAELKNKLLENLKLMFP